MNPEPSVSTRFKKGHVPAHVGQRKTIPASKLPLIEKLAAKGVREKDIGRACDVSHDIWTRCRNTQPEVQAAFDAGRQKMHDSLVNKLYEAAMKGQLVPALFLLKTVFGYREDAPAEVPSITIHLPPATPAASYAPSLTVERVRE